MAKSPANKRPLDNMIGEDGYNRLVAARHGYVLYNTNDVYVGRAIEKYGEWGELEAKLFEQICQPGDRIIEAGANIGTHTMVLARLVGPEGRVYAFEPQRIVFQTLCANLALNTLTNVDTYHAALASEAGHLRIPDIRYEMEGNFAGVSVDGFEAGSRVPKLVLDEVLDEMVRLKLIKVDVEGMELEVLRGASKLIAKFRPILYVENDRMEKSEALIEYIFSLDYRGYWHLPPLFNPDNFAGEAENIFGNVVSANMVCVPRERDSKLEGFEEITDAKAHKWKK